MNAHTHLLNALIKSPTFREYQRAFSEATGLPLALRPVDGWQPALRGAKKENPFCAMITSQSSGCAGCLRMQEELCTAARDHAAALSCPFGLTEIAVPVRLGHETIGFLITGQVLRRKATEADWKRLCAKIKALDMKVDAERLKETYLQTRVVGSSLLDSAQHLLSVFAEHLSLASNQLALQQEQVDPPLVVRVKEFVKTHHEEEIGLQDAAKAAHTSTFYLCKVLKKATGMCFTEYLSRTRIEKAKEMLRRPHVRVSEVAYQVGFQSLTHFNRVFKKVVGESPTEFRETSPLALAA